MSSQKATANERSLHTAEMLVEEGRADVLHNVLTANDSLNSFRILVDSVLDYAVFLLDIRGLVATWNPGAERIKGYKAAEIIGRHFSIFYTPEAVAEDLPARALYIAARDGRYQEEGWRLRKDGTRLWASVVISALRMPDGTLIGFGKVTRDLTDRRIGEEALRQSNHIKTEYAASLAIANQRLVNILEASIFSAIIATDLRGNITTFNRGAEHMLGYTAAEVIGKPALTLFHVPEELERRGAALTELLQRPVQGLDVFASASHQDGYEQMEWTYIHKNGHSITVKLAFSEVQVNTENEPIGYYLGVAQDITQQHRTAAELSATYAQLRSVLDCTSDRIVTIGRDWTLLYGNRRAIDSLPDFCIGRSYWECFAAVIGTPLEATLRTAMETGVETSYEIFYEPYQQWFRGRIFPTDAGLSIFYSDCTKEKQTQEQLRVEQVLREKRIEALSHMAGGLAHEISNPLAIIDARAKTLKASVTGGAVSADTVLHACDSILKTADRANRILRGLRGFGRGASHDPKEWASIYDIVRECSELQQDRFASHQIALEVELEPGIPLVLCRETQIGQILTNLLNNAFDAIEQSQVPERWVRLTAARKNADIIVTVQDSGPGIEDKFRDHLMDAFFTTKTSGLGMGVGLSLSRAIAQNHGGSLTLCSSACPTTCFELVLPIVSDEPSLKETYVG